MISIFSNHIEILSRGTLPPKQILEGFNLGESIPVNEILFEDFDEGDIELFIDNTAKSLIMIDEYFYNLLPNDIVDEIKIKKQLYNYSTVDFVESFKQLIEKSIYRIYGFSNYQERDFQLLFEFYARSYKRISLQFDKVYKEIEIGNGRIDFILNFPLSGEVLFELKMDKGKNVEQAILLQIPECLKNINKYKAFLLIFSTKEDNSHNLELCKRIYLEKKINIYPFIINITNQLTPSKKK